MRITVTGCQASGKTTFIKDFIKNWPMYTTPKTTYRDLVKQKKLKVNKEGSLESQMAILNYHLDEVQRYGKDDDVIFDRGVLDCLVYAMYLYEKGMGGIKEDDISTMMPLVTEGLKLYDIVFWLPLDQQIPMDETNTTENPIRSMDKTFREEINNIFTSVNKSYLNHTGAPFPLVDCPAMIDLHGTRTERIAMAKMYITPEGKPYGEDAPSLIEIP